jgi:DNA-binding FadR family transcriptional regulator
MRLSDQSDRDLIGAVKRTPLVAAVMERIGRLIDVGTYPPGAKLPSERELREQLEVGRSTVREALRGLEVLGLIELRQGRGAFVRSPHPQLGGGAAGPPGEGWQLERVAEARLAIETSAASLAAVRRTDEQLKSIEAQVSAFEDAMAADDLSALMLADVSFHEAIAEAANPVLAAALKAVVVLGIQARRTSLTDPARRGTVLDRHRAIYDAIVQRDPQGARMRMEQHIAGFLEEIGLGVSEWGWPAVSATPSTAFDSAADDSQGEGVLP